MTRETIAGATRRVADRVAAAAARSGRDPSAVLMVAVVKGVAPELIEHAIDAGLTDLAENRAKALAEKAERFGGDLRWHYVGSVQTNKVRFLDPAAMVHSLDRVKEAEALHARGDATDRRWDALIEVNVAGERQKQGVAPDEVERVLERLSLYPRVHPRGFMFMAPAAQNPEDVRWIFAEGRRLRDRFERFGLDELSMGMSDDFEVAIEEGATIVRIGRAIFGSAAVNRPPEEA